MPQIKAHGDVFRDWNGLAGACEQSADLLPGIAPLVEALREILEDAQLAKVEQEHLTGLRKSKTQDFRQMLDNGDAMARKIRAFILTILDVHDERLTQFGIKPIRSRKRKTAPAPPEPPPPVIEIAEPPVSAGETTTNPAAAAAK
jgi:hypothetical protein